MGSAGLRARAEEVLEFYRDNLIRHFRAEEDVLFPFMRSSIPESASLIDLLLRQHQELHGTVARLEAGQGLAKLIFDLGDLLEAHIRKEERELFPLFEKSLEQAKTDAVGAEIKKLIET